MSLGQQEGRDAREGTALPDPIKRFVERATSPGGLAVPRGVRLEQRGRMRQQPGSRWLSWTGREELEVRRVGFAWRARFKPAPLLWLDVEDAYEDGRGRLEGLLFGRVRLFRETGPDHDVGQAMRYLAELPWVPHAVLSNPELEWRDLGDGAVEVSTSAAGRRVAVRLELSPIGDVLGVSAPARPRWDGRTRRALPWGGSFSDFAELGPLRVPTRGEVYWDLPEGRFVYWEGELTRLELV